MSPGVISCPQAAGVADVASVMASNNIHCVVIPDLERSSGGLSWGMVSDVELMNAGMTDFAELTAHDIAASEPLTVSTGESLERACQVMAEHGVSHVLVVDDGSWPVGVLSSLDIAGVMAGAR
jgi:CBS domain-containing protein